MLYTSLVAGLEKAFNAWLALDAQTHGTARERLQALQGRLICLHFSNPELKLYFLPVGEHVRITHEYAAEPDVTIHGTALAMMHLAKAEDTGKAMLEQGITIEGDMALGNRFSELLRDIDVDWEELLSRLVGDTLAHPVGEMMRLTRGWLVSTAQALRLNTREYLQEEGRLLPADIELRHYLDEVDNLRLAVDRLEARLKRLENQQHSHSS